jgi:hypothetical protein
MSYDGNIIGDRCHMMAKLQPRCYMMAKLLLTDAT